MNVHLRVNGTWAPCHATRRACPRRFHLPGLSPAEAAALPSGFLETVFEPLDPPSTVSALGEKAWVDAEGEYHRDYDLPAVIQAGGARFWYRHGKLHRDHDLPATVDEEGGVGWYRDGLRHRDGDRPAVINRWGTYGWFQHGQKHRAHGHPAIIRPRSGQVEYWVYGVAGDPAIEVLDGAVIERLIQPQPTDQAPA